MGLITVFITAVGLSMDTFAVAVSNGVCVKKLKTKFVVIFSLYLGFFQGLMPVLGFLLAKSFSKYIVSFDHWVAFVLLGLIGGKLIFESFQKDDETCDVEKKDSDIIKAKNMVVLSIATSIDAMALGIVFATFPDFKVIVPGVIIACVTFIFSCAGLLVGNKMGGLFKSKAELFGGLVLIGIGVKILVEHLFFS